MRRDAMRCVLIGMMLGGLAPLHAAQTVEMTVYTGGNLNLDGNCGPTTAPNPSFVIGTPGSINNAPLWYVSKFKLSTILPPEVTAEFVLSATLYVPDQDLLRNGQPGFAAMHVQHFATTSDTTVTNADGGYGVAASATLHEYPDAVGGRQPLVQDLNRFAALDVTAAIKDDLTNGRALASFRLGHTVEDAAVAPTGSDNYQIGDSDAIAQGYCNNFAPPNCTGVMRLVITYGTAEICTNGLDDDGDGNIDCADSECASVEPCKETNCSNSLDGDGDGLADCQDPDCTDSPSCPELCDNGLDDDADGAVDCADSECTPIEPCIETVCDDGLDGDNDTLIDCQDPNCTNSPLCPEDCANTLDDDADGLTDCADPECFCNASCTPPQEDCDNNIDEDCDGLIDCADPQCSEHTACKEFACNDGIDNDTDGQTDCADLDCTDSPACPEVCTDATDNDADGAVDCGDIECFGQAGCTAELLCEDGLDNDNDGATDAADSDCPIILHLTVAGSGNTSLDAHSQYLGESPNLTFIIGIPGSLNAAPIWFISKFDLSALPPGTLAADIASATLSVPDQNLVRNGNPRAYDLVVQHFATSDNTKVINADRHEITPALTSWLAIPAGGTGQSCTACTVDLDVTAAVRDDLANGRALSSYRAGHDPAGLAGQTTSDIYQWGSADCAILNGGAGNPGFCPPSGDPNVMELTIVIGGAEECTNGLDDNANGLIDCQDAACRNDPACPENCTNGVDDNGDGQTDCADVRCRCDATCGPNPIPEVCGNRLDDDCDGRTDCADFDSCSGQAGCSCSDPFADVDGDGDVDQVDFAQYQRCYTGPGGAISVGCTCLDRPQPGFPNGDGDVDVDDLGPFIFCASGPDVSADAGCD